MNDLQPTFARAYPDGSYGGQCGDFAHKLVVFPPVGNSIQEKINAVNKFGIPVDKLHGDFQAGDVIIFNVTQYGHVAVINLCMVGGNLQLSESNWNLDEKVHNNRQVLRTNSTIVGVIRGPIVPPFLLPSVMITE